MSFRQLNGKCCGAISDYTQALTINPRDHDCYFYRAQARERKGELESAAGDYGKVIEVNPQSAEAYAGRGILRLYQKID
jgi:tetratricopeptide (TPR) repeat protein